jgi:hypothetical protein
MNTSILRSLLLLLVPLLLSPGLPAQASATPFRGPSAQRPENSDAASVATAGDRPLDRVHFLPGRADGATWAIGTNWKAGFDDRGFTAVPFFGSTAPRNFPIRFELLRVTAGAEPLPVLRGEPVVLGNQVRMPRGGCVEVVDTALDQLEQSFVFDRLPNRSAIAVELAISTELTTTAVPGGLRFGNEFGHVDYTKAVVVDAAGRRLPLDLSRTATGARIEIPAAFVATAQLPIVLDPVLNFWWGLASGVVNVQHDPDVASFQALGGRTLVIFQRDYSSTDSDCWGILFDTNLGLVRPDFPIDVGLTNWIKVAVAANNSAQNFLVVAEVNAFPSLTWYIAGCLVSATGTVGNVFDIERENVVGLPGNNFAPDVGGDPYPGPSYYCVVFAKNNILVGNPTHVYSKLVTSSGTLLSATPTLLGYQPAGVTRPAISKSCGAWNGQPTYWLATWDLWWLSNPERWTEYRFINWNGSLPTAYAGLIGSPTTTYQNASPGSPIDIDGVRYWPLAVEASAGPFGIRDVQLRYLRADQTGAVPGPVLGSLPANADDFDPEIDSDGNRVVVTRTVVAPGMPRAVQALTVAFDGNATVRVDEVSALGTPATTGFGQNKIGADFSGGNTPSARYFVVFKELANNSFRLVNHGGWSPGTTFSTFPSQCGTTTLSVTGVPVLGQPVTFQVSPGPLAAVHIGTPGYIPLNALGCNCVQGVNPVIATFVAPWTWTIPNTMSAVGLTFSAQGFHITGTQCLGFIDLSDTIDFTIR